MNFLRRSISYPGVVVCASRMFFFLLLTMDDGCYLIFYFRSRFETSHFRPISAIAFGPVRMSSRFVDTQYGKVHGVLLNRPGRNLPQVEVYRGLQYASVLGGELRFMPPTSSIEKWDGIRVAAKFRPVCPQRLPDIEELRRRLPSGRLDHFRRLLPHLQEQEEECLNLNIYVPVTDRSSTELFPVVVFIHGDSYDFGTGNAYDGSMLAAFGMVIVVTINYRLGVLGFLSTGDSDAPGNYALLDQVAAMHWIKGNIQGFGGDPDEVTLLGHGYGAAMVNLLVISPVTRGSGLFRRAIMQSGSALASWSVVSDPLRSTRLVTAAVNCSTHWDDSRRLLQCLKRLPWQAVSAVPVAGFKYLSTFGPTVDGRSVLPTDVRTLTEDLSEESVFAGVDLLLGVMKNEGFSYFNQTEIDHGMSAQSMRRFIRTYIQNVFTFNRQYLYDVLLHQYQDWHALDDPTAIRDLLMELVGDGQQVAPLVDLARRHDVNTSRTFLYCFHHPTRFDVYPRWADGVHGDDLEYVFGAPLANGIEPFATVFTTADKILSEIVLRYWINFIRSGDPNEPNEDTGRNYPNHWDSVATPVKWPEYNVIKQQHLHLGLKPSIKHHFRAEKMALWLDLIPKLHRPDTSDSIYHRLEHSDDPDSFEDTGTKDLVTRTTDPFSSFHLPTASPSANSTSSTSSAFFPHAPLFHQTITTSGGGGKIIRKPPNRRFSTSPRWPPTMTSEPVKVTTTTTTTEPVKEEEEEATGSLSLSVTLSVGCGMLALNVLLFVSVLCVRRFRLHQTARRRERYCGEKSLRMAAAGTAVTTTTTAGGASGHHHERIHVIDFVDRKSGDDDDISRTLCLSASPTNFRHHYHPHHSNQQHHRRRSSPNRDAVTSLSTPPPSSMTSSTYSAVPRFQTPCAETDVDLMTPTLRVKQGHAVANNRTPLGSNNHCSLARSNSSVRENF